MCVTHTHSKCCLALAQQHDYDHKCFEHSCCYCNSQKNLLNAFLHDVLEYVYRCVHCTCTHTLCREHKIGDHGALFSLSLAWLGCQSLFSCRRIRQYVCNLQANKRKRNTRTITMFGPVSSCTTLLLVIGRREIRFYTENDHVFSLLNYLLFDICFFLRLFLLLSLSLRCFGLWLRFFFLGRIPNAERRANNEEYKGDAHDNVFRCIRTASTAAATLNGVVFF